MQTALIVTIDTEEEGLWSGTFATSGATANNVTGVPRFQSLCDEFAIQPTYLVNSPVIEDLRARSILREIADDRRCEIGAHIHPWNTAPVSGTYSARASYLCNLPASVQRAKLETITAQVSEAFDIQPRSFRAGRYGLDAAGAGLLSELGYTVDSSVCPFTDYSADGGPDFRGAPWKPYWVGEDLCVPESTGRLLEVPVSFGFDRPWFTPAERIYRLCSDTALRACRAVGILDRLHLLRKIKFSPEKGDASRLNALARAYVANGSPCLVMMFHSSSLLPGNTPYVPSDRALDAFMSCLRGVFEYCLEELGMRAITLGDFAAEYAAPGAAAPASGARVGAAAR